MLHVPTRSVGTSQRAWERVTFSLPISSFISRTARSKPTISARATMLWPMFSSCMPSMAATGLDIVIGQAVAGVQGHAGLADQPPGLLELLQFRRLLGARPGQGVLAGVQLDGVGLQAGGHLDLPRVGIEEQADGNAGVGKRPDRVGRPLLAARRCPGRLRW